MPVTVTPPVREAASRSRGYSVRKTYSDISPDEAKRLEDEALEAIAEAMRP